jgi:chromosome segregation ATPase
MIRFQEMQAELQEAHKRFDGNFDRLEKANLTTWQMAERLAEEKNRVAELEKHIIETKRRIEISNDRLTATKCPGCDIRFDASKAFQLSGEEDSML